MVCGQGERNPWEHCARCWQPFLCMSALSGSGDLMMQSFAVHHSVVLIPYGEITGEEALNHTAVKIYTAVERKFFFSVLRKLVSLSTRLEGLVVRNRSFKMWIPNYFNLETCSAAVLLVWIGPCLPPSTLLKRTMSSLVLLVLSSKMFSAH